jgi:chlorobactene glucosyltransferase
VSPLALAASVPLAAMLGVALWNTVAAPRLERAPLPRRPRRVSVLVPARDEAANLRETLPALLDLAHPEVEVVVLDDGSTDDTAAVVGALRRAAPGRLRALKGLPVPDGWLGKNWACHQLAGAADGEVLVFCDADVAVRPDALWRTLGAMEHAGAGALTALTRQRWRHWSDRALVPLVVHLPVLALLPLPLVPRLRAPSVSMGNGQWFALTRAAYRDAGGHAAVRGEVAEDVALARRVKASGHRLVGVVSTSLLEARPYRDAAALREGFVKNLYALAGARPAPFAAALALFLLTAVYPWVGALLGSRGALVPLALLAGVRACGAILFRHGAGSVVLHPVGSVLLTVAAAESFARARRGSLAWKGRRIDAGSRPGRDADAARAEPGA